MTASDLGLIAALGLPLALAAGLAAPWMRRAVARLAPWAALPALVLAWLPEPALVDATALLLDARFGLSDALTRRWLLLTAAVWLAAGWFASSYLAGDPRRHGFWFFFLASLAGNLGLVLARDVVAFYACFTWMTFAAYGLVVHDRSDRARHAGTVYIVLGLAGELMLIAAFMVLAQGDATTSIAQAQTRLASSPHGALLSVFVLLGFGVKAGALVLHVWLPLAHPVAPAPASAVLSGAMIKAGLLGWLRFLPLGTGELTGLGLSVAVAGIAAAVYGALIGATQRDAKTVLAYSSISQMGILTVVVGVALASAEAAEHGVRAVGAFALQHALAKGALFLGAGLLPHTSGRAQRGIALGALLLAAASIAGAPLSSGAGAKAAIGSAISHAPPEWHVFETLLSIAAVGSTLIMLRFLVCAPEPEPGAERLGPGAWIGFVGLVAGNLALAIGSPEPLPSAAKLVAPDKLWKAAWPVLAGAALGLAAGRLVRVPQVPPGDVLLPALACLRAMRGAFERAWGPVRRAGGATQRAAAAAARRGVMGAAGALPSIEKRLARYSTIGALLGVLLVALLATLLWP